MIEKILLMLEMLVRKFQKLELLLMTILASEAIFLEYIRLE
jgi:hypothetical protein